MYFVCNNEGALNGVVMKNVLVNKINAGIEPSLSWQVFMRDGRRADFRFKFI